MSTTPYKTLAVATHHPEKINPYSGLWNARSFEAFCKRDVEFDVVSPRPFAPPLGPYSEYRTIPKIESFDGYELHRPRFFYGLPKRLFYSVAGDSFAKRIPKYTNQTFGEPDIIHACHIYIDGYGYLEYAKRHEIPMFTVAHGSIINEYDTFSSGVQAKIRDTLRASESVLCVSRALEEGASDIVPEVDTTLFPIGANPDNFPTERAPDLRETYGVTEDETLVLFCGWFNERKGINEVIDVLPDLPVEDRHYVFVGHGGELREPLERTIAKNDLEDSVDVYEELSTPRLREFFAMADLLLLPSHAEGRPTVIYEAMAAETAILASSVGGIPEQVADGETGVLIQPKDRTGLQESLDSLTADRDRLQEMGQRGNERLHDRGWTWAAHAERMERIHREALAN